MFASLYDVDMDPVRIPISNVMMRVFCEKYIPGVPHEHTFPESKIASSGKEVLLCKSECKVCATDRTWPGSIEVGCVVRERASQVWEDY